MRVDETMIEKLVEQLTLEEKIGMIHGAGLFRTGGVERLGIPSLFMSDGPMGVRSEFLDGKWEAACTTEDYVTYLPSNSALASTWNRELAYESGKVLGCEARGRGKDIILAPGINIKRSPLCGRNFEYMSEDPYLTAQMAVPFVKGVQENDVAACVKHFAANSQETERLWVDTRVDERTLQEIYYPAFFEAVEEGECYSVMGAYNKLNGEHCCHGRHLLGRVLRRDWQYDGLVVCDWGGIHDTKEAAQAPIDIEMSVDNNFDEYNFARPLLEAVKKNEIDESDIDAKIRNILRLMFRLKIIGAEAENRKPGTYNTASHRDTVYQTAKESIILLKNNENRLPIQKKGLKKLGVIGLNAEKVHALGGGSAEIKALYEISPLLGLHMELGGNTQIVYAKGYKEPIEAEIGDTNWQESSLDRQETENATSMELAGTRRKAKLSEDRERQLEIERKALLEEAVAVARNCEEVIFVGGLNHDYDVEGLDRENMKLPYRQDELIQALLEANPNTIVVIYAGSPVDMTKWADKAKAILWSYYAGMEGGRALAEIIFGEANPSGKLAETFVKSEKDTFPYKLGEFAKEEIVTYKDGVFVGYRYYDKVKVEPMFCFGHGLSYTEFSYNNLLIQVEETNMPTVLVAVDVTNVGEREGAEAVQLYVHPKKSSLERPDQELRGFQKVLLEPGEKQKITFQLDMKAFSYYEEEKNAFYIEAGEYLLRVGASSRDIRLESKVIFEKSYIVENS
ncbi:beta-glucosidase family protein [Anaerosacchariphilus polymeriproducens]|nr:glycoside hydrolase family 3 C-terminal domain-containing protein [Anaerosacchariphilus polymeriproducens]